MRARISTVAMAALVGSMTAFSAIAASDEVKDVAADHETDGKYFTKEDIPTFHVDPDGTVDWYTYSGFRRYHSECHVCHGPDGEGSTYAPALKDSVMKMDYYQFVEVVTNGRQNVNAAENKVMPSFGVNPNVMCYLDDIYIYLRARGADAIPRGRPPKKQEKPQAFTDAEHACMG